MPVKLKPLHEQVMVITGASSGIGLATALKAAEAGARVFLVARGEAALEGAVREIDGRGGEAAYAVADVGDLAELQAAAAAARQRFGAIDTWVSNAGVAIYSDLLSTPRDEHERLFQTNYWGAVNSAEVAIGALKDQGGAFIVVGSIASDMGSPVLGAYVASKHAVKGYLDSLRVELNRDGVPVSISLIKPSGVGSPLNVHLANHRQGEAKAPPPIYSPELVADVILRAAEHPIREQTVGGVGVAQVMFATHFPALFAKVAGWVTPLLNDPKTASTGSSNLFAPGFGGATVNDTGGGRKFSLYSGAHLHPLLTGALVLLAGAAATTLLTPRPRDRR